MRHDLRFALRHLARRPAHTALVVLTLGLGIGASLAVVSVVDAVLLRPLPFPGADRLVSLTQSIPSPGFPELSFSDIAYRRVRDGAPSLEAVAAYTTRNVNLVRNGVARRLVVAQVTANLFDVLQVAPAIGRRFTPAEDLPGAARLLVLSDQLWRTSFNADSSVIGGAADLEGEPFTIIGVLPASEVFPSRDIAAWEPMRLDPASVRPDRNSYTLVARTRTGSRASGRDGDGDALDAARREVTAIIRAVGREFPGPHPGSALDQAGYNANVRLLSEQVVGDVRPVVLLLLGGVCMLLVLTCANAANLQLASVIRRTEEFALRAALGATRTRVVSGALLEGLVVSFGGVVVGAILAVAGARLFEFVFPLAITTGRPLFSVPVLIVAGALVACIGGAVGALPVWMVVGRDPALALRDRTSGSGSRTAGRMRRVLAAAQLALAVMLVHSAGLLLASASAVRREPLGFTPASTMSVRINIPVTTFRDRTARETLLRRLVDEVGRTPGVTATGLVNALPLTQGRRDLAMAVEGRPFKADGTDPLADYRVASAGYFAAMGIPLVRGRLFTDDDASPTYTPIVISEGLSRLLFQNGEDPIGQRLRFGPASPWMPIIGVVADAKNRRVTEAPRPELYTPGLGTWSMLAFRTEITIVARASGDAASLARPIQRLVAELAPDVATYAVLSMDEVVREARARMVATTRLMTGYALAAFVIAMAGVYAVLAYLVAQRRHEIAVRLTLGATPDGIVRLVARESFRVVAIGTAAGIAGALMVAQLLAGLLYGVGSLDAVVLLCVVTAAAGAAIGAAVIPAYRASRVDPATSLRGAA